MRSCFVLVCLPCALNTWAGRSCPGGCLAPVSGGSGGFGAQQPVFSLHGFRAPRGEAGLEAGFKMRFSPTGQVLTEGPSAPGDATAALCFRLTVFKHPPLYSVIHRPHSHPSIHPSIHPFIYLLNRLKRRFIKGTYTWHILP